MAVPVGQDINVVLESRDVIHAYYVPQFLFKRDVVPGRISTFTFHVKPEDANKTFGGQCAELCGSGHRVMTFEVHAMTRADFDTWLQDHIEGAPPPPPSGEPAPSGEPPAPGESVAPPPGGGTAVPIVASPSRQPTSGPRPGSRSPSTSTTRTPAFPTTSTSATPRTRSSRTAPRSLGRARSRSPSIPSRPAPTPSSARSTRT